jgi:hypothetical protein
VERLSASDPRRVVGDEQRRIDRFDASFCFLRSNILPFQRSNAKKTLLKKKPFRILRHTNKWHLTCPRSSSAERDALLSSSEILAARRRGRQTETG